MFDFDNKIIVRSYKVPVLVEFSSPSCGPCYWMEKTLIEVTREMSGQFEFVSLPIEECADLVRQYQILSNPTTILYINGEAIARLKGALPKIVIKQWLKDHI